MARFFISRNTRRAALPVTIILPALLLASSLVGCAALSSPADQHQPGNAPTTQPAAQAPPRTTPAQAPTDTVGSIISAVGQVGATIAPAAPQVGGPMALGAAIGALLWGFFKNHQELSRIKTLWDGNDRSIAQAQSDPAAAAIPARSRAVGFHGDDRSGA